MKFALIRAAFFGITFFTFLNTAKIIKIPLHFPWLILFIISFAFWIFWEIIYKNRFDFPAIMAGLFLLQLYDDTLGNTFKLYGKFNWYDKFTHTTGGAVAGALTFLILCYFSRKNQWKITLRTLIIFAISLALSLSVFYEFWEYFAYSVLDYKSILTGLTDTSHDLFWDLVGATVCVLFLSLILKKNGYPLPNKIDSKTK